MEDTFYRHVGVGKTMETVRVKGCRKWHSAPDGRMGADVRHLISPVGPLPRGTRFIALRGGHDGLHDCDYQEIRLVDEDNRELRIEWCE